MIHPKKIPLYWWAMVSVVSVLAMIIVLAIAVG